MPDIHAASPVTGPLGNPTFTDAGAEKIVDWAATALALNGKIYASSGGSDVAVPSTDAVTGGTFSTDPRYVLAPQEAQAYLISLVWGEGTEADAIKVSAGPKVTMDGASELRDNEALLLGALPDECVPIAYMVLANKRTSGAVTEYFGKTNWNASDITVKVGGLASLVARPVLSKLA